MSTARPCCPVCHGSGDTQYTDVVDVYFGASGRWDIRRCVNDACGLWWLDPMPSQSANEDVYDGYFTRVVETVRAAGFKQLIERGILAGSFGYALGVPAAWRVLGRVLGLLPAARDEAARRIMWLPRSRAGVLLDVGCGSGTLLQRMRSLGWQVRGVEPDQRAAAIARDHHSLQVHCGTLLSYAARDGEFDAITLNHVIEHVPDPVEFIRECSRILRPGGWLVVVTPNVLSLGRRVFGRYWRGLEVPRHLSLFAPKSLTQLLRGTSLRIVQLRTPARSARWMWATSSAARSGAAPRRGLRALSSASAAWLFQLVEHAATAIAPVGEEILLIVTKD